MGCQRWVSLRPGSAGAGEGPHIELGAGFGKGENWEAVGGTWLGRLGVSSGISVDLERVQRAALRCSQEGERAGPPTPALPWK